MANATLDQSQKQKIIWAIDPTQKPDYAKDIVKELKIWSRYLKCDVQPVTVISTSLMNLPIEMPRLWEDKNKQAAEIAARNYLKKCKTNGFLAPHFIYAATGSTRGLAAELAKYAEKQKATLVFANTRMRPGGIMFRLGGFSETLISTSRVPVLVLNPSTKSTGRPNTILFPTDLDVESEMALKRLIPWAKAFRSKVLVYNQVENPIYYPSEFYDVWQAPRFSMTSILKDQIASQLTKANRLSTKLKNENIKCDVMVLEKQKYVATEILDIAKKKKISLIALATRSGPISQMVLGSVAKDILLNAKCPVLFFYRPKPVRTSQIEAPKKTKTTQPNSRVILKPFAYSS